MDFKGFRPVGEDLEGVCCGCGEALLISSGDVVNFRAGNTMDVMGVEVPVPAGLLCSKCSREENGDDVLSIKFARLVCASCGVELSEDNSRPEFDEGGELKGMMCFDCSEPWRRSLCQED